MIQRYGADGTFEADARKTEETGPVFADPSGQRRRLMRVLGGGASVLLVGALIMAGIGLLGGPDTPFTVFGASAAHRHGHQGTTGHGHKSGPAPGSASNSLPGATSGSPPAHTGTPSPSPSPSHRSPTPTPTSPAAPTNKAGKTPPGLSRSPQPNPSPSSHGI